MVTKPDGWFRRRIAGWSVRRRYVLLVLVPALGICCVGTTVGVPLAWAMRLTDKAGRGAPSPDSAASQYLMALGYNQQEGLLPLLDDEHQDELLDQWRTYRAAMDGTDPPPSVLDFGSLAVRSIGDKRAEVSTDVAATWWSSKNGEGFRSESLTWRFVTQEDDGWRVSEVMPPAWCDGYVLLSHCRTR